jgi:hypothetical protein
VYEVGMIFNATARNLVQMDWRQVLWPYKSFPYGLAIQTFSQIRQENRVYVDKTQQILSLTEDKA